MATETGAKAPQAGNQNRVALITPCPHPLQVQAASSSSAAADASTMAPRRSESPRALRAALTATALLVPLLLSSFTPVTDAAAGSPSPVPARAPLRHPPPPLQRAAPGGVNKPHAKPPPVPRHPGARRPPPRAPRPTENSAWRRLSFGERFGIALAGVAVAVQVALGVFLCARARQLRRAAAAGNKAAEEQEEEAAPSSSTPS
ncbi:hypothetical protein BAE44_0010670 [Dichanthelium oligosanthes]|uniref:Uncharacterized protein n=1 Tax=Dichanthelium oligosanthes TaxID=888268 RepID=A0A1E5VT75_9POAL|nr:hypothetical protein BAE44_0010670 [Dichanthelium oligosanthes]